MFAQAATPMTISYWLTPQTYFALSVMIPVNFNDCSICCRKRAQAGLNQNLVSGLLWGGFIWREVLRNAFLWGRGFQDSLWEVPEETPGGGGQPEKKKKNTLKNNQFFFFFFLAAPPPPGDPLLIRQPRQWSSQSGSSRAGRSNRSGRSSQTSRPIQPSRPIRPERKKHQPQFYFEEKYKKWQWWWYIYIYI